jgi:integrase
MNVVSNRLTVVADRPHRRARRNRQHRVDAWRMIQRRSAELGMKIKIGCHTFRATGITGARKSRAPPSSMIAPAMKLRSMKSSGLRSERAAG